MENKIGNKINREFKLTTIALRNKSTMFLIAGLLVIFGIFAYNSMPRESFPEVEMPYVFVKTIYPGNPPVDMENLITRPLEKEIHSIQGIKKLLSTSSQDNSDINVEFNSDVDIEKALQDVKDAVDKAKSELPEDLTLDPIVMEIDFNEFPIVNINLSGDFGLNELKEYAEYLEDEIEGFMEISKVEIKGLDQREIQINVDPFKLSANELSFQNIEDAVASENVSISGGDLIVDGTSRTIRTIGEFKNMDDIRNIIIKHEKGNIVYLKDVAEVIDGFEDSMSYARLDKQPVVSLQVIKKSGENLINATDKIFKLLEKSKKDGSIPKNLRIDITNDQSDMVKNMVSNLENSIIMGVIFVVLVLFFFLGFKNSILVGMAIPMSMFLSFIILSLIGSTINMMTLFSLVLALGMLVDNAIVVVENMYRFVDQGYPVFNAAKRAVGEIAVPIIASTATTLAAFFPLIFWTGMMGEFMKHLPITLIIVLSSSLVVALIIIPVFAAQFIKKDDKDRKPDKKKNKRNIMIITALAIISYLVGLNIIGSLLLIVALLITLNLIVLFSVVSWFQNVFLEKMENFYLNLLKKTLKGKKPILILLGTVVLFVMVMIFFGIRKPRVELFPVNEPSFVNMMVELPVGSDISATNQFLYKLEDRVFEILKPMSKDIKSILTTIGKGVAGENEMAPTGNTPNKAMMTITFVDYEDRINPRTSDSMKLLSKNLNGVYPGINISIVKSNMGPPTGKPVNLEITGVDFEQLIDLTERIKTYLNNLKVEGIEELKIDMDTGKPEMIVDIDRDKARRFGLSTAQIASTIRTALFGKDISDFKENEDKYDIVLRFNSKHRYNSTDILNQNITFRDQTSGKIIQIPISAVASARYSTTYDSIKRKDMDRVITIYSNLIEGYNGAIINKDLQKAMEEFEMPTGYTYKFTGEQEDQKETTDFLFKALLIALSLIIIIMVTQFNSLAKTFIIMTSVFFSTIGVFGGIAIFKMDFIIIMTGIGIISLAGVVVNNAIVLIDYIDLLKSNKKKELGIDRTRDLSIEDSLECIIQGGKTRLRPVLLTAITTILGLIPMAIGLNINFGTLLSSFNPQLYVGGDNAVFWGPMAWTVIFGLTFATFLTLILVPAMYFIGNKVKLYFKK